MHLSDQGGIPIYTSMSDRGVSIHLPLSDEGGVCVWVCTKQNSSWWVSHPLSSVKEESKHCLVSDPPCQADLSAPSAHPGSQAKGGHPNAQNLPQSVPSYTQTTAHLTAPSLQAPQPVGGRGHGAILQAPSSVRAAAMMTPTRRCNQKGGPVCAQTSCIIFCADFRQPREEDTELYFPSSWKPLINVNWH